MLIKSNAKINLELNITGKKRNMHTLESIIVPIDLYDNIEIQEAINDEIIGMDIDLYDNIMYKALNLIRNEYHITKCVKITIDKKIPIMAGLGGGSSNAMAILKGLNTLWNLNINEDKMKDYAVSLGSDVSFFINNKPSLAYGTGEIIEEIKLKNKLKGVLIFDNDYSQTKEMFTRLDNYPFSKSNLNNLRSGNITYHNDFDKVFNAHKLNMIKSNLISNRAYAASLSGSGGSIFGLFKEEDDIARFITENRNKYKNIWRFEVINNK